MSSYTPVPKMVAAGVGGALATLAVWLLNALTGVEVPAEAAAALTALLSFAAGYIKSPAEAHHHDDAGHADAVTLVALFAVITAGVVLGGLLLRLVG